MIYPQVKDITNGNLDNIDLTFGLKNDYPGLGYIVQINGPPTLIRGFLNGSRIINNPSMATCDYLVSVQLTGRLYQLVNITGII